ncbi:hypothetical protein M3J09_008805 [Ascochyta lentis]
MNPLSFSFADSTQKTRICTPSVVYFPTIAMLAGSCYIAAKRGARRRPSSSSDKTTAHNRIQQPIRRDLLCCTDKLDSSACSHRSSQRNGEADACIEARPQLFEILPTISELLGRVPMCHDLHRLSWNEALSQRLTSYVAFDRSPLSLKDRCILQ